MRYKISYRMEMTIDPATMEGHENREIKIVEIPLGETQNISGTKEYIQKKISHDIDRLAKYLDEWFYGEDVNGK